MMTRDEFQLLYARGPEAVYAYIRQMQDVIDLLTVREQQLTARVEQLEARLGKDSHNSSKPPSSDGPARRPRKPKSLRQRTGPRPGGQPGHPGHTLAMAEQPDETLTHRPDRCRACGEPLDAAPMVDLERRQVHDLPPMRLRVTEHQALRCKCPRCHTLT